jgi:2'-5' RNA ligase
MKRTFIAFQIQAGDKILECAGRLKEILQEESIKWVDPDRLHATLAFLGDTKEDLIPAIGGILEKYVPAYPSPGVQIRGMGVFRSMKDPRVIWLGMAPMPSLAELKEKMDRELGPMGFQAGDRPFRPHLTLGRIKRLKNRDLLSGLLQEYRDHLFQEGSISELVFYESILRPEGPVYHPLLKVPFGEE